MFKNRFKNSFKSCLGFIACLYVFAMSSVIAQTSATAPRSNTAPANAKAERFPKQIQVEGVKLNLNGQGTRYKAIFKVYDMGLYTTTKVRTAQELAKVAGPVKLQFIALRDLSTIDIALLLLRGMQDNSTPELNSKHAAMSSKFIEMVETKKKILAGETFAIEFVPGLGVTFLVADKPLSSAMGNAEFFGMIMRIWLGPVPADYLLRDALLAAPKA